MGSPVSRDCALWFDLAAIIRESDDIMLVTSCDPRHILHPAVPCCTAPFGSIQTLMCTSTLIAISFQLFLIACGQNQISEHVRSWLSSCCCILCLSTAKRFGQVLMKHLEVLTASTILSYRMVATSYESRSGQQQSSWSSLETKAALHNI